MGITNLDVMTTKSGLDLKNCYLTFTAGPQTMPNPINMICQLDQAGKKVYYAHATLYVYASPEAKKSGLDPVETNQLRIPVDASGVFNILFASLKKTYTNVEDVLPSDEQSEPQSKPPSSDPPAQPDTTSNEPEATEPSSGTTTAAADESSPADTTTSNEPEATEPSSGTTTAAADESSPADTTTSNEPEATEPSSGTTTATADESSPADTTTSNEPEATEPSSAGN